MGWSSAKMVIAAGKKCHNEKGRTVRKPCGRRERRPKNGEKLGLTSEL